jgi:tripartite-type tricarboxylate transporter receptor subunit TctC
MRNAVIALLVAAGLAIAHAKAATTAPFPSRPVTIVMGASAGGITDVAVRAYAKSLSRPFGQPVLVDNRPTEAGAAAAAFVQNARADGYTLLAFQGAQHVAMPLIAHAAYEPVKGFAPVTTLFVLANFLAVPADSPARTVAELIRLGRAKPEGLRFGSSGLGTTSHLTAARLSASQKMPIHYTHYAGAAPMIADLAGGKLDFTFVSYAVAKPHLQAGRIRVLAVDAEARWPDRSEVPTLRETGIDQPKVASWFGLAAPAGTPLAVIRRLHDAFAETARDPDVVRNLRQSGAVAAISTPQELQQMMEREAVETAGLVRSLQLSER